MSSAGSNDVIELPLTGLALLPDVSNPGVYTVSASDLAAAFAMTTMSSPHSLHVSVMGGMDPMNAPSSVAWLQTVVVSYDGSSGGAGLQVQLNGDLVLSDASVITVSAKNGDTSGELTFASGSGLTAVSGTPGLFSVSASALDAAYRADGSGLTDLDIPPEALVVTVDDGIAGNVDPSATTWLQPVVTS